MKKVFLLAAIAAFFMPGCMLTPTARTTVAGAYDQALESAEMTICNDASVGAILRRYGQSAERATEWRSLCFGEGAAIDSLVKP